MFLPVSKVGSLQRQIDDYEVKRQKKTFVLWAPLMMKNLSKAEFMQQDIKKLKVVDYNSMMGGVDEWWW